MARRTSARTVGSFFDKFNLDGADYFLFHVSDTLAEPNYQLEWAGDNSFYVQATMPFDLPGDWEYFGDGHFVVSGRDSVTSTNYLLRLELTLSPPNVHIKETYDTGTFDAVSLAFNSTESRLYLYDGMQRLVSSAAWTPWSPLPNVWSNHDLSGLRFVPSMITKPYVGEGSRGVYLRFRAAVAHGFDPNRKVHVYLDNGTWRVIELYSPPFGG